MTTTTLDGARHRLLNIGYRLLGSLTEAEDAVQEAYARWYALPVAQQEAIRTPDAWLATVTSRICLDLLGSARARRERYVGEWIPEPVPDRTEWPAAQPGDGHQDPAERIALDESVDMALLVVLETMTPAERVAFVLHDVFGYPFGDVAVVLDRTAAACRQLTASARRRVRQAELSSGAEAGVTADQARVVRDFKHAWERKDIAALVALLAPGAVLTADGGGLVSSALQPLVGAGQIVGALLGIADRSPGQTLREYSVNGRPGLVSLLGGTTVTVAAFALDGDGRIARIWAVRNPEKLQGWEAAPGQR
ncbi:RNA polymerase sigma factor SigJ [Kitasatospora sp. NPDC096147]|uniref:RNA polymerase sigma factor SigJ n=1 Tax=Kitasatospora sp. NPDC096147 TaxID=3364093 RepID=UPI00380BCEAB